MSAEQVLEFWLDTVGPQGWYEPSDALDQTIRDRFMSDWLNIVSGKNGMWLTYPSGTLAYIIVADQFSRNMFRNQAQAFSSDRVALSAAKAAIDQKWDLKIDEPARQFFYLPLMHSESLCDQDRCVRLMKERMPQTGENTLTHARVHREVIRLFGRFPYRNTALNRETTSPEAEYLSNGGYGMTYAQLAKAG